MVPRDLEWHRIGSIRQHGSAKEIVTSRRLKCEWNSSSPAIELQLARERGIASYYDAIVDGTENPAAAWYYADPKSAASEIKNRIAFWKGDEVR